MSQNIDKEVIQPDKTNLEIRELAEKIAPDLNFKIRQPNKRKAPINKRVANRRKKEKNRRKQNRRK